MLSGLSPGGAPGQVLAFALVLGAGGVVQFFRLQRRRRAMEDMPTARIRSASQGYAELIGQALPPDAPLFSPLSRTPCCWYRFKIEKRDRDSNRNWSVEQQGVSTTQFWLDDDTGRCIIDPEGAEVRALTRRTWTGSTAQVIPGTSEVMMTGDNDHRYTEHLILPGQTLYALGWFASLSPLQVSSHAEVRERIAAWKADPQQRRAFDSNGDGALDMAEFEQLRQQAAAAVEAERRERAVQPQTHVLRRPKDKRLFLLTTEPHDDLTRTLRWQAWAWLTVGVLGLAYGGAGLLMLG
ncbi:GIDE domain-containing protein [Thiomonas intermedia]|uniref:GIDE domain-containing protein n=1 Tax=Thiomonas intermedia TaxID=926 RepID=UPI0009A53569|nr:GIDE domain-containing protein [Thiomonas intermedia]